MTVMGLLLGITLPSIQGLDGGTSARIEARERVLSS
jgi:hypothetical protein